MRERIRARKILKGVALKQWGRENNFHMFPGDAGESWMENAEEGAQWRLQWAELKIRFWYKAERH